MKKILMSIGTVLFITSTSAALAYDDVTPTEAYNMATSDAYILDVRTPGEWRWAGHPGKNNEGEGALLDGKVFNVAIWIETKGGLVLNPSFITDVNDIFEENKDAVIITMCLAGGRSPIAATALEDAGYTNVFNMLYGFQGGKDSKGYRTVNGWVVDNLPYTYNPNGIYDE